MRLAGHDKNNRYFNVAFILDIAFGVTMNKLLTSLVFVTGLTFVVGVMAAETSVSGTVTLSSALANKAGQNDTVFIFARAAKGPKMPLAVFRKQVKDLPMEFALDDTMAMRPGLKMSGFDQIVVIARISKSGKPMANSGDLEGSTGAVKPGAKGLKVVIDRVVP